MNEKFEGNWKTIENPVSCYENVAVMFRNERYGQPRTVYFLCYWFGFFIGPLLMAFIPFKTLKIGVFRGDKFKFMEWSFK